MGPKGADELIENLLDKLHLTRLLEIRSLFGQLMDKSLWFTHRPAIQNVSSQPSIALPVHVTDAGLPLGIQAVGRPGDEQDAFVACRADGEGFRVADAAGAAQGAGLIRQISSS
ncbi:hypothetical protein [Mesorhizobium sp. M0579]|uniref:hypothetical protein n=1 Tax=Mesorhizobium sp. M0579 TaxID=2956962 RepID=UPI00333D50F2